MAAPNNAGRLSEIEYCMDSYFRTNIVPIMNAERDKLQSAQTKEVADYSKSFAGIMRQAANASNPFTGDDTMQYLRMTGKKNGKTAEDYVEMCRKSIAGNKQLQGDLARLAGEWRKAIVAEVGRARYDQISRQIGCDLAFAYVDYRMEQSMIDKMVSDEMPRSSFDYILRKGAGGSLLGLPNEMLKSPLEQEIEARGEAAYRPSKKEKAGARAVSFGTDAIAFGGVYSWGALARMAGTEVVFVGLEKMMGKPKGARLNVEQCISNALWGTQVNVFADLRKRSSNIKTYENVYIQSVNRSLSKKMDILTTKPLWMPDLNVTSPFKPFTLSIKGANTPNDDLRSQVPMIVALGKEREYLDEQAALRRKHQETSQEQEKNIANGTSEQTKKQTYEEKGSTVNDGQRGESSQDGQQREEKQREEAQHQEETNQDGWAYLLSSVGLDNFSDIGRNLPYVIATLPDMLVGLFTGKTSSVNLKKDMIPVASILLGMFIKNPMLKMLLIGMGGMNLLNKMGHESLDRMEGKTPRTQYKQYSDEELNPRIASPTLNGNTLVATIDGVPCSVAIPDDAARAYASGALPLNTLANAILAKHDQMRELAGENYRSVEMGQDRGRERGMALK